MKWDRQCNFICSFKKRLSIPTVTILFANDILQILEDLIIENNTRDRRTIINGEVKFFVNDV